MEITVLQWSFGLMQRQIAGTLGKFCISTDGVRAWALPLKALGNAEIEVPESLWEGGTFIFLIILWSTVQVCDGPPIFQ
ncbi:hypothetical protein JZU46_01045, partial [bacterium]|nr:hypothetical protein [bacterium]